jgi:hypothetical protein
VQVSVNGIVKSSNAVIEGHIKNANAAGGLAAKPIDSVSIDVLDPKKLSVAAFSVTDPGNPNGIPVAPPQAQALLSYLNDVYQRQAAITFTLAGNQVKAVNVGYDINVDGMLQNPANAGQVNPTAEFDKISQAEANVAADRKIYYVVAMVPLLNNQNATEDVGWTHPNGIEAAIATLTGFANSPPQGQNVPPGELLYVSAHELGHMLGLVDTNTANLLMDAALTQNQGLFPKLAKADWDTANAGAK